MKSIIFTSLVVFIQFFLAAESRAIDKELSVIYKFDLELDKYKHVKDKQWDVDEIEGEVETSENNIFKRMALEDDEEFEKKLKESENEEYEDIVDEIPNEFSHEDNKLSKRATISSSEYFKVQLSAFEQQIYISLYKLFNAATVPRLDVTLSGLKNYKANKAYALKYSSRAVGALVRDHPEFWWIKKYTISYSSSGNVITKLKVTIQSSYNIKTINNYKAKVRNKGVSIANAANKQKTVYKRLLYIHDYLVKYIKYNDKQDYSYNLYGALLKNACACEGYAESFTFIARLVKVPVISVASTSHKWNYVHLNSKWYALDVTFDDPTVNGVTYNVGETKNLSHKFFLVGKNTIIKGKKTYATYSNRNLVNYVEFTEATGFKFPALSATAYS